VSPSLSLSLLYGRAYRGCLGNTGQVCTYHSRATEGRTSTWLGQDQGQVSPREKADASLEQPNILLPVLRDLGLGGTVSAVRNSLQDNKPLNFRLHTTHHELQHMTKSQENVAVVLRKKQIKTKHHRSSFLTPRLQDCTVHISQ
jgi:hypothetical protein